MSKIILFGGSFDPPGLHHQKLCMDLRQTFPEVRIIIVPCGYREDKNNQRVELIHRINLAKLMHVSLRAFNVELDLFDLENKCFTPTCELDKKYSKEGEVWHFIGADIIAGGANGNSEIQNVWEGGQKDFDELRYVIFSRPGVNWSYYDLPPHSKFFEKNIPFSSTEIRKQIGQGDDDFIDSVPIIIWWYIKQHNLYNWPKGGC
ncbi:hypothetical protein K8R32_04940 [bacterium]|nr:hypothetical protein [bacterium]